MKRENFKSIIKNRSCWKIDKRKGNYTLPNGERLNTYIESLVNSQMEIDNLGVAEDGNLYFSDIKLERVVIYPPFKDAESCSWDDHEKRIERLIYEIIC